MGFMFSKCISITTFPEISNWDTSKVIDMNYMFNGCLSLNSIPDIYIRYFSKIKNIYNSFGNCINCIIYPYYIDDMTI